jgi:hypothetical protein
MYSDGGTRLCARFQPHILVAAHAPQVIFDNPLMAPSVGVRACC